MDIFLKAESVRRREIRYQKKWPYVCWNTILDYLSFLLQNLAKNAKWNISRIHEACREAECGEIP